MLSSREQFPKAGSDWSRRMTMTPASIALATGHRPPHTIVKARFVSIMVRTKRGKGGPRKKTAVVVVTANGSRAVFSIEGIAALANAEGKWSTTLGGADIQFTCRADPATVHVEAKPPEAKVANEMRMLLKDAAGVVEIRPFPRFTRIIDFAKRRFVVPARSQIREKNFGVPVGSQQPVNRPVFDVRKPFDDDRRVRVHETLDTPPPPLLLAEVVPQIPGMPAQYRPLY